MLAITRFLAASNYLQEITPKLEVLREEYMRAEKEHERLERAYLKAEDAYVAIKNRAWSLVERAPPDVDVWLLGELHPDYW